ncbi:acyltransferase family protein [Deinococcus navajonensis]|uniref:Acyltransferase family protein n=1 Tax=Deinococcus navajonensis TaxID=309884 RepID=A0ABV8XRT2_9DEIO
MTSPRLSQRGSSSTTRHIASLDALRGLAALSVVLFHVTLIVQQSLDPHWRGIQKLIEMIRLSPLFVMVAGSESVLVFFILSGFVLYLMLSARPLPYALYVRRRLLRLYPPYLVAVLISMALAILLGGHKVAGFGPWINSLWQQPPEAAPFLHHVLVIGNPNAEPYNFVLWSLVQEMQISLIFPLLYGAILRFRPTRVLAGCLVIGLMANAFALLLAHVSPALEQMMIAYLDSFHYLVFFAIGALMARHSTRLGQWYGALSLLSKLLLVVLGLASYTYGHLIIIRLGIASRISDLLVLPGAFMLVLLFSYSASVIEFSRHPSLQFLGRISYSLYLYHGVILLAFLFGLGNRLPLGVLLLLALICIIPLSALAYHLVERPAIAWSRQRAGSGAAAKADTLRS